MQLYLKLSVGYPISQGCTRCIRLSYHRPYKRKKPLLGGNGRHLVPSGTRKTQFRGRNYGEEALKLLPAVLAASSSKGIISGSHPPTGPTATPLEHRVYYLHLQKY